MKKKIFPIIKSLFIIALAGLAVFQISRLWLVNITNRGFILYLQARFPPAAPDGQSAFARPFRIISGAGDGLFEIRYSGIEASPEWEFGEAALDAILRSGSFNSGNVAFEELLSQPVFIFEYAFEMRAELFARALGRRNADLLTEAGIETFNSVAVRPPCADDAMLRAFFIGGEPERIWEFTLQPGTRRHPAAGFEITVPAASPNAKHFVATAEGFAPRVPFAGFSYNKILADNLFRDPHGMLTLSFVRTRVEPFFDNPATIISVMGGDNVYTFSNRNTVVRYLESDVIEYLSFRTIGHGTADTFMADFSAALAFITYSDPGAVNEIYLRNHEAQGRENIFWFNYVIDNRPLVLKQPWYTGPNCTDPMFSPIEVIVDNGRVVRYRRLAYTFRTGGISWMDAAELDREEFFTLGFPIGSGPEINLAVFLEVLR